MWASAESSNRAITKLLHYSNGTSSAGNSGLSKVCGDQLALTDKTLFPWLVRLPAVVGACLVLPQHNAFCTAGPSSVNWEVLFCTEGQRDPLKRRRLQGLAAHVGPSLPVRVELKRREVWCCSWGVWLQSLLLGFLVLLEPREEHSTASVGMG